VTVPPGSKVVVIFGGGGNTIVIDKGCSSTCPDVSVTRTVKFDVPAVLAALVVPEITPVVVFRLKFCGSDPAIKLQVRNPLPPEACKVFE
jgi:hypothetical protein